MEQEFVAYCDQLLCSGDDHTMIPKIAKNNEWISYIPQPQTNMEN